MDITRSGFCVASSNVNSSMNLLAESLSAFTTLVVEKLVKIRAITAAIISSLEVFMALSGLIIYIILIFCPNV